MTSITDSHPNYNSVAGINDATKAGMMEFASWYLFLKDKTNFNLMRAITEQIKVKRVQKQVIAMCESAYASNSENNSGSAIDFDGMSFNVVFRILYEAFKKAGYLNSFNHREQVKDQDRVDSI